MEQIIINYMDCDILTQLLASVNHFDSIISVLFNECNNNDLTLIREYVMSKFMNHIINRSGNYVACGDDLLYIDDWNGVEDDINIKIGYSLDFMIKYKLLFREIYNDATYYNICVHSKYDVTYMNIYFGKYDFKKICNDCGTAYQQY